MKFSSFSIFKGVTIYGGISGGWSGDLGVYTIPCGSLSHSLRYLPRKGPPMPVLSTFLRETWTSYHVSGLRSRFGRLPQGPGPPQRLQLWDSHFWWLFYCCCCCFLFFILLHWTSHLFMGHLSHLVQSFSRIRTASSWNKGNISPSNNSKIFFFYHHHL